MAIDYPAPTGGPAKQFLQMVLDRVSGVIDPRATERFVNGSSKHLCRRLAARSSRRALVAAGAGVGTAPGVATRGRGGGSPPPRKRGST